MPSCTPCKTWTCGYVLCVLLHHHNISVDTSKINFQAEKDDRQMKKAMLAKVYGAHLPLQLHMEEVHMSLAVSLARALPFSLSLVISLCHFSVQIVAVCPFFLLL